MTPGRYDLNLYRGDTYSWRFQLWDDPARTEETDLTGVTAEAEIRDRPGGTIIAHLNCVIILPNIIDVSITTVVWSFIPDEGGVWDLELAYSDGRVRTPVAGRATVTKDVTNSEVEPP